jgi:hypothetical protein
MRRASRVPKVSVGSKVYILALFTLDKADTPGTFDTLLILSASVGRFV